MNYILSPEFHRNLWLRFSRVRIAAVPLLLALCVMTVFNIARNDPMPALQGMSLTLFCLIVFIWGNYEAANAMQEEVKGGTWDQQKMSALTPMQLAFGKLFGATSYVWYAGLSALLVAWYAYAQSEHEKSFLVAAAPYLFAGAFGHAAAFLASLADLSSASRRNMRNYIPGGKGPFVLGLGVSYAICQIFDTKALFSGQAARQFGRTLQWFGSVYDAHDFLLGATAVFCGWCLIGVYRLARAELMYRMTPAFWVGFVATAAVYIAGFPDAGALDSRYHFAVSGCLFAVFMGFTYLAMLSEAPDTRRYGRLFRAFRARDREAVFANMPKWVATLPFVLALYAATLLLHAGADGEFMKTFVFTTAILLFAARDACVNHVLLTGGGNDSRFRQVFYYLLAYAVLPALHMSVMVHDTGVRELIDTIGNGEEGLEAAKAHAFAWYFPTRFPDPVVALLPAAAEAAAAGYWLFSKLKPRAVKTS